MAFRLNTWRHLGAIRRGHSLRPLLACKWWHGLMLPCLAALASPAWALPSQILLLRHGHKNSQATHYNLSEQGFQRSIALATLLPACFGLPDAIVTYLLDADSSKNARSYQTAVPLAIATGVNIRIDQCSRQSSYGSGRQLLTNPAYRGERLVLFWEHRRLPELAAGLGWSSMPPMADDDFDTFYLLQYQPDSPTPLVRVFHQNALLSGRQSCTAVTTAAVPQ